MLRLAALIGCFSIVACSAGSERKPLDFENGNGPTDTDNGGSGGTLVIGSDGGAANNGGGSSECAALDVKTAVKSKPVDIILAVDTSYSMTAEAQQVHDNLAAFATAIRQSGVDANVVLIAKEDSAGTDVDMCIPAPLGSGSCPNDDKPPAFLHIDQYVASTDALKLIISTKPQWNSMMRPGSIKAIAVVSDDNASATGGKAMDFKAAVSSWGPDWANYTFNAIVCKTDCDYADGVGTEYLTLVEETGGIAGDLCFQNFAPVFGQLSKKVVDGSLAECEYTIPANPEGGELEPSKVNFSYKQAPSANPTLVPFVSGADSCGTSEGVYFDDPRDPSVVQLCPATCNQLKTLDYAEVSIRFGCEQIVK